MKSLLTPFRRSRLLRWLASGLALLLLIILLSWLVLPIYLKSTVQKQVAEKTGRHLTLGKVAFNPFTLTLQVPDIVLYEADNTSRAFGAALLTCVISPKSLVHLALVANKVELDSPTLHVLRKIRNGQQETNFTDMIQRLAALPSTGEPVHFFLANMSVINGAILFDDDVKKQRFHVDALDIGVPFLSNFPEKVDVYVEPYLSAKVNGSMFELKGRSKPFAASRETSVAINLNKLDLAPWLAFSPTPLPFVMRSGQLSTTLSLDFSTAKNTASIALAGTARLNNIALNDLHGAPWLSVKAVQTTIKNADLVRQNVNVKEFIVDDIKLHGEGAASKTADALSAATIALKDVTVTTSSQHVQVNELSLDQVHGEVYRDANGLINVGSLLKPQHGDQEKKKVASTSKTPSWQAVIDKLVLAKSSIIFSDQSTQPVVTIQADAIDAKLENISSTFDRPINATLRANLNKSGSIAMNGTIAPKAAQLAIDLQNFSIVILQPYFTQFLNITLEKGATSAKGQLHWTAPNTVRYQGQMQVTNFASSDKATSDRFLKWNGLDIQGIDVEFGTKSPLITVGKVNINDFYARAILSEKGSLNLENVLIHPHAASTKGGAPTRSAPNKSVIKLGQVNLHNGVINYSDNFIKPHYSMHMTGMNGRLGTLQSNVATPAPFNLNGKIDNSAPISISGALNPLVSPMVLDIKMSAHGIELPRLTTYSAKYAGYAIEKGKLSFNVEYHLKDNQLTASNSLTIDQLTFGNKVDSPFATKLPVLLLTSLLADRNGQINLDVPISGTINDPQFSLGGLIVKVVMKMLGKVLTSPFSLLAHSFPHSEELSFVEFDSGSSTLTDAIKAKLDTLATALTERPNLKLDITGRADLSADETGLRERKLARQIRKESALNEDANNDSAALAMTDKDRTSAVRSIYSQSKFDKPRNKLGLPKYLSDEEMQTLIKQNTPVTDDDLISLANRRAAVVRAYLTDTANVSPDRVFTLAPKINGEKTNEGTVKGVDFGLAM